MYQKTVNMLKNFDNEVISTQHLKSLMRRHIGGNEQRTIVPYLKLMREEGIITEVSNHKWRVKLK